PAEPAAERSDEAAAPAEAPPCGAPGQADCPKERAPVTALFTDDFELRLWQVPERLPGFEDRRVLDYVEQVNRFTANVRSGPWSGFAQVDQVALMANRYFLDDVALPERDLLSPGLWSPLIPGAYDPATQGMSGWDLVSRNLYVNVEKLRGSYQKGPLSIHLGDTYAAFGRGLALNLNRNVDIDIDTSLQGLKVQWRPGPWDFTALLAQTNRQQVFQDNPNRGIFGDRRHTVAGLRLERWGLGKANLGAHLVSYSFAEDPGWSGGFKALASTPDAIVGGGSVELQGLGPTDWYLEVDGFGFPTDDTSGGEPVSPGYAAYLSSAIYAGPTIWLIEAKRYFHTQQVNTLLSPELYQIAIAPTLEYERQITEDSAAAASSNDIWGARVRMDWMANPGVLTPYWSLAVFRDLDLGGLHFNRVPETIYHPLIGLEYTKDGWSVIANVGHRIDDRDGADAGMDLHLHGDVLSRLPLSKRWFLDVSVAAEWYRWGVNPFQQADYVEMESAVSLQLGSLFAFTWFTDYSDNPLIDSTGNLSDVVYGAAEVQVQPLPALTIKAFYGAYKSGIRCSGGQCRVLPGFEGARLSLVAAF
ncbi:MAG TPA: hypothetical protein PKA64_11900, partial [Myxococcota bacterium]|nr:hypothetical protein [Myxococcota bacterium]